MSPVRALLTGVAGGVAAAVLLPLDRPGIGWPITAVLVLALVGRVRPGWAVLSVALFATGAFYAAEWLFALCAVAGCAAGSLAVAGGRTARGLVLGAFAVPAAALRALPWAARGVRGAAVPLRPVLLTAALLLVFVPLLAGADPAFADLLGAAVPDLDGASAFAFAAVGLGVVGACHLVTTPVDLDGDPTTARTAARKDWVLPVSSLVVLFTAFVLVQVRTLFGGDRHVQVTADLTYAGYARSGFWQLLAVTLLTLGVIAVVAQLARLDSAEDRRWLRGLLGSLAVLTLVIVASALARMWVYQQAYGFTVLRVVVSACELWLGVVYLLVLAAGVKLEGGWLPRAVVGTGLAALLGLALLDPDRFIAERNVARWHDTGRIDREYLSRLSADAAPVLAGLGLCPHVREDRWQSWNLARATARDVECAP